MTDSGADSAKEAQAARTIEAAGRRWTVRNGHEEAVRAAAQMLGELDASTQIKRNLSRAVHQIRTGQDASPGLILKWHNTRRLKEFLKYTIISSRARTEWHVSRRLRELGLPAANVIAFSETRRYGRILQDAISICEEVPGALPLATALKEPERFGRLFAAALDLVLKMHAAGVDHTDLHGGNILARPDDSVVLIDLHAVKVCGSVGLKRRIDSLAQLMWSLQGRIDGEDQERFLRLYAEQSGLEDLSPAVFTQQVRDSLEAYRRRRFHSRTLRCQMNSSKFCIEKPPGLRIHRRREMPLDDVMKLVDLHHEALAGEAGRVLKRDARSAVTHVTLGEWDVCVKGHFARSARDRLVMRVWRSRGKRAWIAANGLIVRGVPTAFPLAMADDLRSGESFVITRYVENTLPLDLWVETRGRDCPPRLRRKLVDALAGVVRKLHDARVYAVDLSPKNVLVRLDGDEWKVFVVDLDNTHLWRRLTHRRRLWNLAQLNDIPDGVTPGERMRFFREYAVGDEPLLSRADALAIMKLTKERHERWRRKTGLQ